MTTGGGDGAVDSGGHGAHALAGVLAASRPGPALAALLSDLEPADLPADALVEGLAAFGRLHSWAVAGQARLVAELHRRREPDRLGSAAAEVAARLATTRAGGEVLVGRALGLEAHPAVADALEEGRIDTRKADVLLDVLHISPAARDAVIGAVLPDAERLTAPQLRRRVQRAEITVSPGCARARAAKERAARHVELRPATGSMAWLSVYLPAVDALTVWTALDALADARPDGLDGSVERAFDGRGVDARRVDALVDLAGGVLESGAGPHGPLRERGGRTPHLTVTATAESLAGLSDDPAELEGYGAVPVEVARRLLSRATWEPLLLDARTGAPLATASRRYRIGQRLRDAVALRDVTCTFPGCRVRAERCDLDHVEPYRQSHGESSGGGSGGSDDGVPQTREQNLHALCRHHHRLKTLGGWEVRRDVGAGRTEWTAPSGLLHIREPHARTAGLVLAARPVPGQPPDTEASPDTAGSPDTAATPDTEASPDTAARPDTEASPDLAADPGPEPEPPPPF